MITRHKLRSLTSVDAAVWDGVNLADIRALCPQVQKLSETGTTLMIPAENGLQEVYVGEIVIREVGTQKASKLSGDLFRALYTI